jgi:beta-glucanase (GH16 family)
VLMNNTTVWPNLQARTDRRAMLCAFAATLSASIACAQPAWQQVWSDEFTGTSLNAANWTPIIGPWPYNDERQYYSANAISVSNGLGVITSTNQSQGGRLYTSGRMDTNGKQSFLYGKFEMRARLPRTQGIWPAFWLLPTANQWPPEIDIMEMLGHEPHRVYASNHWGTPETHAYFTTPYQLPTVNPNFSTTFNTFSCEWWPDRVEFFVNNNRIATHYSRIPQEPMYVIVNTAVGGFWPGYPNATTTFPQRFEIDWIRVSQVPGPMLKNTGMEWPGPAGSGQRLWHWQSWGNAEYSEALPKSGVASAKMYGNFNVPNNSSGFFQDLPCSVGQTITANVFAQTPTWDRMGAGNVARLSLEFRSATNTLLQTVPVNALTSTSTPNTWIPVSVTGVAPANASTVRVVLSFQQGSQLSAGAAWFDELRLQVVQPVTCDSIDFNNDGLFPDDADLVDFLAVLGGAACSTTSCNSIDFNNDNLFPDDADLLAFLRVLAGGACEE